MAKIKKMGDGRFFRKRINENGKRENKNVRMRGEENHCFSLNAFSLVSEQQTVSASDDI